MHQQFKEWFGADDIALTNVPHMASMQAEIALVESGQFDKAYQDHLAKTVKPNTTPKPLIVDPVASPRVTVDAEMPDVQNTTPLNKKRKSVGKSVGKSTGKNAAKSVGPDPVVPFEELERMYPAGTFVFGKCMGSPVKYPG
jgi:hypothetical protein